MLMLPTLAITPKPCAPGNFRPGRRGHKPIAIVVHVEDGCETGTIAWFDNPAAKVSAHYSVSKAGELFRHVNEEDTAFHAGNVVRPTWTLLIDDQDVTPNLITIGIEHEGCATDEWPDEQYQASATLIADISIRNSIPIDADHVIPHRAIRADKTCPGKGDVSRLILMAQQIVQQATQV